MPRSPAAEVEPRAMPTLTAERVVEEARGRSGGLGLACGANVRSEFHALMNDIVARDAPDAQFREAEAMAAEIAWNQKRLNSPGHPTVSSTSCQLRLACC